MSSRLQLPGSHRHQLAGAVPCGKPDPDTTIRVTLVLRRPETSSAPSPRKPLSRRQFAQFYAADPLDVQAVLAFADSHQLRVVRVDPAARTVTIAGRIRDLAPLFEADLQISERHGARYRTREGALSLPPELAGRVVAVLGFDNRPAASTYRRRRDPRRTELSLSYTPTEIAELYNFPAGTGKGQTIALIELGGGYRESDLQNYWRSLGLGEPNVTAVGIDDAANAPTGDPDGADGEVVLDIEIAGVVAPGANIIGYFAPNTDQGFLNAINTAIHDAVHKPSILSISWGSPENEWTAQSKDVFSAAFEDAARLGITVCVASGDNGSSDGEPDGANHVDFPASSPWVLACGGTRLIAKNGKILSETVWNDGTQGASGGGVSVYFAEPAYQAGLRIPKPVGTTNTNGRGVPDVSGAADPQTGYRVLVDGVESVVGGTSAVAPLWAALIARCNERLGQNAGFLNPVIYRGAASQDPLRDITCGTNGAFRSLKGWDSCTGLGSPDGTALLKLLKRT